MNPLFFASTTALFVVFAVLMSNPLIAEDYVHIVERGEEKIQELKIPKLVFVGDVMLGRTVENIIEREGVEYPFRGVADLLNDADATIGNFEGVVTIPHEQTPGMGFRFSVKDEYVGALSRAGFDILSLSNNHSYDFGGIALEHTRERCIENNIVCGGSPFGLSTTSTYVHTIHDIKIGFIFLHTLYSAYDESGLRSRINVLKSESDVQIAYIHWGDEYSLTHNQTQEAFAHLLIDSDIDAVVGHHPHVVQDVELYQGKPIFYSLGNFIFDQYFSKDVEEMIALQMEIGTSSILYRVIPLSSKESKSQPRYMGVQDALVLIKRIFKNYGAVGLHDDGSGEFLVER